jgi:hypothetical protein
LVEPLRPAFAGAGHFRWSLLRLRNCSQRGERPQIPYTLLKSIVLGSIVGFPNQMIRWGSSGIAFITENGGYLGQDAPGMTYILSGDALAVTGSQPGAATEEHVQFTWRSQLHKKR